ncbi:hypothetical protein RAG47_20430, partial [Klebsiella pneumoniae]
GTVCVVGKMRDLILQLSKSSIYSTKPMKRIMLAVFVICGALSLSGCILPPGPHSGGHGGDHFHGPEHR